MEEFRFLDLDEHTAYENMAIDEAIMLSMKVGEVPPTIRFYRWNPSAVSIGIFQGMREEVDIDFCKRNGIDFIRRITGGGAVYHDYNGEITYSIILPRDHPLVREDIIDSYGILCKGIIHALRRFELNAEFKPINDIVVNGTKVSGNAQTRRHGCVLQHGTVLLNLDAKLMFAILRVPIEKISDKMIKDAKERVTSISDILGKSVSIRELRNALADGFSTALNIKLNLGRLTRTEQQTAASLAKEKYATEEWNLRR